MAQQKVNQEIARLTPSALLELFEIDGRSIGVPNRIFFHAGTNNLLQSVVFNSISYFPFPIEATGFEIDGKGSLPRPRVKCSNVKGIISNYLLQWNNLIGAKFVRRRIFLKYIDAINFPGGINPYGISDVNAAFPDEIFKVSRKVQENREFVEFELGTPLEVDNVKLPKRPIYATVCSFRYRDPLTCSYTGNPVGDRSNKVFGAGGYGYTLVNQGEWSAVSTYNEGDFVYITSTLDENVGERFFFVCRVNGTVGSASGPTTSPGNWIADICPRSCAGCKLRFPTGSLPFGGFPGVAKSGFIDR